MEKSQHDICIKVLKRFQEHGILNRLVIIGSWCLYFYKNYFQSKNYYPSIRTRDLDFLVPLPFTIKKKVNIPQLLKDMGFVISFFGEQGYIKLDHPDLILEFLVPEMGRGSEKPYKLPQLGLNAQRLRYLNFLASNTIKVRFEGLVLNLPHPGGLMPYMDSWYLQEGIPKKRQTKSKSSL